ncbi:MAG: CPBP family intramembrane metalloprotease [Bradymonadales bacterium]|nr:CPBP family intramembrane metalloprotease [Bradymonadales bacterium]
MRFRVIRTIAAKELLESFRDRRTLFLMVFLPVILYPLLLLLVTQVSVSQKAKLEAKPSVVGYTGADENHPLMAILAEDRQYQLVAVDSPDHPLDPGDGGLDCLVDVSGWPAELPANSNAELKLHYLSIEDASRQARDRLEGSLSAWSDAEVARRLEELELSVSLVEPVTVESLDQSAPSQVGGFVLGAILPILVILTVILGAFYPAIDLTAGEKERGSIQTLYVAPISSFEIAAGKYLAVVSISMVSGMANLLSIALLFSHKLLLGEQMLEKVDFSISGSTLVVLFFTIFLIALFFSALLLTVAVLARSYKEAQNYLTPVMLAAVVPASVVQLPGFELTPALALVPAVNAMLLMKQVLVEGVVPQLLFLVAASTALYTALVLMGAGRLFAQEEVILGERGNMTLLARRSQMRPRRRPSSGEGLALFGVVLVLLFYVGSLIQAASPAWGLAGTLWGVVLIPTVGLAWYLKLDFRHTFQVGRPTARSMLAAGILGICSWSAVTFVSAWFDRHVLPAPPELAEEMIRLLSDLEQLGGWPGLVLLVAVSPAICEEALCRGFLFSGLRGRLAPWALVLVTGVLFGLLHLNLYRLVGTTLLGVVMGLLVYKSGSIWTSVLFHALNNGVALLLLAIAPGMLENEMGLPLWLVGVGLAGTAAGLALIARERSPWATNQATD